MRGMLLSITLHASRPPVTAGVTDRYGVAVLLLRALLEGDGVGVVLAHLVEVGLEGRVGGDGEAERVTGLAEVELARVDERAPVLRDAGRRLVLAQLAAGEPAGRLGVVEREALGEGDLDRVVLRPRVVEVDLV